MTALLSEQSNRVTKERQHADEQLLDSLREWANQYKEGGHARSKADLAVGRVAELIESEEKVSRCIGAVQDAQKLAMAQLQFSQQALRQLEKQMEALQLEHRNNGNGKTEPAVDLKGK